MPKYRLQNLDCANCALEIEERLRETPGVRAVNLNFSTATLHLDADDPQVARRVIAEIEPQVRLLPAESAEEDAPDRTPWRLGAAGVCFVGGLLSGAFPWLRLLLLLAAYLLSGYPVLAQALHNVRRGQVLDENFLITVATLGAWGIGEPAEAVGVMLFYGVGEYLQERAVGRSRRSIQALLAVRPDRARVQCGEAWEMQPPEAVAVGQRVMVNPGERIPLDGRVHSGESLLDTAPLTGESTPRRARPGDEVLAGMVNQRGVLILEVTRPFGESSIARMLDLVENAAARKAAPERMMTRIARWYTPVVAGLAVLTALLPPLLGWGTFAAWGYRALTLLVISCPCALVISIPLGYFGGIGAAAQRGILVKGAVFLDVLARVRSVLFDKTGTLTSGDFRLQAMCPADDMPPEDMLALAAHAEAHSAHPIAEAIRQAHGQALPPLTDYEELAGFGVRAQVGARTVVLGNDALLHRDAVPHDETACAAPGTSVHMAVDGRYQGYLQVADALKAESAPAVAALRRLGVRHLALLTGDRASVAADAAHRLGLDAFYAEMLPDDKLRVVETLLEAQPVPLAFVGDGINDAPALRRADVGIAMGALGSQAAIESADVVIMTDSPLKVAEAVQIARRTRRIVWQNIGMALGIKAAFILLGVSGQATLWQAVFADVGVALLAVFNAMRIR
ncbi:MAG: heavy metal translocating P-type ATPase [Anaerolineales bacterium]